MLLIAFISLLVACVALALSMRRHFTQFCPQRTYQPKQAAYWRQGGYLLLLLGTSLLVMDQGWGLGLVFLCALLNVNVFLLAMLLAYHPKFNTRKASQRR